jgi:hypothetical protein
MNFSEILTYYYLFLVVHFGVVSVGVTTTVPFVHSLLDQCVQAHMDKSTGRLADEQNTHPLSCPVSTPLHDRGQALHLTTLNKW